MLSGFLRGVGANLAPITLSYVTKGSATGTSLTIPATSQAGDLCILMNGANGSSTPTLVTPSGFTNIQNYSRTQWRYAAHIKKLVSGDPGSSVSGMSGSGTKEMICYVFRPSRGATYSSAGVTGQDTTTTPANQTIPCASYQAPVVAVAWIASSSAPSFTSGTFDQQDAVNTYWRNAYKLYNTSPSDNTVGMGDYGSPNFLGSFLVYAT